MPPNLGMPSQPLHKRQRASRACDFCHSRGLKCRRIISERTGQLESLVSCLTCLDYGAQCTINRPIRKRGRKPALPPSDELIGDPEQMLHLSDRPDNTQISVETLGEVADFCSLHVVRRLVHIYRDTMYQC